MLFCLFNLIIYVPSSIFQLCRDRSSWVEPVLSEDECVLLKETTQWRRWGSIPRPRGLEPSTIPLSHCAPYDQCCVIHKCVYTRAQYKYWVRGVYKCIIVIICKLFMLLTCTGVHIHALWPAPLFSVTRIRLMIVPFTWTGLCTWSDSPKMGHHIFYRVVTSAKEFGLRLFGIIGISNKVSRNVSQNCRLLHLFELEKIFTSL